MFIAKQEIKWLLFAGTEVKIPKASVLLGIKLQSIPVGLVEIKFKIKNQLC